jgi:hypothetical protein
MLHELDAVPAADLLDARLLKFDRMGVFQEAGVDSSGQPVSYSNGQ